MIPISTEIPLKSLILWGVVEDQFFEVVLSGFDSMYCSA